MVPRMSKIQRPAIRQEATQDLDSLFPTLSRRLTQNPKYRIKMHPSKRSWTSTEAPCLSNCSSPARRQRIFDYLASFTDALVTNARLENSIEIISEEIALIGKEVGLGDSWMNLEGDTVIKYIEDDIEDSDDE